jgi:hypothetical protein
MIGFNDLGSKGWLGNQMFQYAGLRGIAAKNNYEFCIPPNDETRVHNYSLLECFEMSNCNNIQYINAATYHSDYTDLPNSCKFEFSQEMLDNCPDEVNITGFFQSEKYFKHIEYSIRQDFKFKKQYLYEAKSFISQFEKNPIFLHIRRQDYIASGNNFHIQTEEYYREGLKYFSEDLPVIILSDDIDWCKSQDIFSSERFLFYEKQQRFSSIVPGYSYPALVPFVDLCIMSLCSGGIISNSTLSWWGAWLIEKENKIIIAPKNWFGAGLVHKNTQDIIPKEWIKL